MEDNSIYLYWETAADRNIQFFVVERSNNNIDWSGIKTIASTGNSQNAQQYFFLDKFLQPGKYYYRIKQVDAASTVSFSNTVNAEVNTDIYVSGVLAGGNSLFIGGIANINDWQVSVLSSAASLVMKPAMLNTNVVNIPEVSTGVYLLKLQNKVDGKIKMIRFTND